MKYPLHLLLDLIDEYDNPDVYQEHDIQHIVSGDLHARPWSDIQPTWRKYDLRGRIQLPHTIKPEKRREPVVRVKYKRPSMLFRVLARILVANGLTQDDAIAQARLMLKEPAE
jgi:hypothetical protein